MSGILPGFQLNFYQNCFLSFTKRKPWGVNRVWNRKENEWKNGINWKNLQHDTHILACIGGGCLIAKMFLDL